MDTFTGLARTLWDIFTQKWQQRNIRAASVIGNDVSGQTIIVTGPTGGIGERMATTLALRGATVILACRSLERGNSVKQRIQGKLAEAGLKPKLEVHLLDISCLSSVRSFAKDWIASGRRIDVLIQNAGIFNIAETKRRLSADGFESHLATNYLGPFLLTLLLLPALQKGGSSEKPSRVILVSSILHFCTGHLPREDMQLQKPGAYNPLRAYSLSKVTQVLLAAELRRRLVSDGRVAVFACHPGECTTDIARSLPRWIQFVYQRMLNFVLIDAEHGSLSALICATSDLSASGLRHTDPAASYVGCNGSVRDAGKLATSPEEAQWLWDWSCSTTGLDHALQLKRT